MPPSLTNLNPFVSAPAGKPKLVELDTGRRTLRVFGVVYDLGFFESVANSEVGAVFTLVAKDDASVTLKRDHDGTPPPPPPPEPAQAPPPVNLLTAEPVHEPLPPPPESSP